MVDHGREVHPLLQQLDFAATDARDLQQVVYEADEVVDLPLHQALDTLEIRSQSSGPAQHMQAVADRRERIAQLMRERRDEFVLAAVGFQQFFTRFFQSFFRDDAVGVVDRDAADQSLGSGIGRDRKLAHEEVSRHPTVVVGILDGRDAGWAVEGDAIVFHEQGRRLGVNISSSALPKIRSNGLSAKSKKA